MIANSLQNRLLAEADSNAGGGVATQTPTTPPPGTSTLDIGTNAQPTSKPTADQQKIIDAVNKTKGSDTPDGKPVTPKVHKAIFKAPPGELLEKEFNVTDDLGTDDSLQPIAERVDPDAQQKTTKKDEKGTKKDEGTKTTDGVPPQKKETTDTTKPKLEVVDPKAAKGFNYDEFTQEEAGVLRQMSSVAREFTAKQLRELKKVKTETPAAYYQHPNGYTLLPEYQKINDDINWAAKEQAFWKQQLINIRQGKPWRTLTGWDEQGKPILSGELKATEEADIDVSNVIQSMSGHINGLNQQRAGFQNTFNTVLQQHNQILQEQRNKHFAWNVDPKLLEEKITLPDVGERSIKQIREDFMNMFAPYHHQNPLMELLKDMFAGMQIYGAKIRHLEGVAKNANELKEEVIRMEPSPETVSTAKNDGDLVFDTEGIKNL